MTLMVRTGGFLFLLCFAPLQAANAPFDVRAMMRAARISDPQI